jgi:hypothetical protein
VSRGGQMNPGPVSTWWLDGSGLAGSHRKYVNCPQVFFRVGVWWHRGRRGTGGTRAGVKVSPRVTVIDRDVVWNSSSEG